MGKIEPILVKNFLDESEQIHLSNYTWLYHIHNETKFCEEEVINTADTGLYADYFMESLLLRKKPIMEKYVGKKLFPSHSFWRMYTYGAILYPHKDRPSCEYSVTIQISSSGEEWPIYINETPYTLNHGDALIYDGVNNEHWRHPFKGDYSSNLFLHYVDQNGPVKHFHMDTRPFFGCIADTRRIKNENEDET